MKSGKTLVLFPPCNLLHQPEFSYSCGYDIMTALLTSTPTVGKANAQHGAISFQGEQNSVASSEAARCCGVELQNA